jgi:membrane fusion protein (multidrug efflux system)
MFKKIVVTVLGIAVIAGTLIGIKMMQFKSMGDAAAHMVVPPETVTAAAVSEDTWPNLVIATGSVAAMQGVTIGAETPGKVVKIAFESGQLVKKGDVLVQLDVSTEEAQLRAAEATGALAKANLVRSTDLLEKQAISQSDFDLVDAQAKQAEAQIQNVKAVIAKKTIHAPFDGRLGLRLVNLGQILSEGAPIATLQTLDPVYVNFSLPQQRLPLIQPGGLVRVTTDAAPGAVFEGKINAISPEVDTATRNIRVQATIANVGEKLRAGMFANVQVVLPSAEKVLSIPATSVLYAPYGDSVFVIVSKKDEKSGQTQQVLEQKFVRLGEARGDFVAVETGLKAGDQVVTSGVFKLRPGTAVVIDNKLAPQAKLTPTPDNT